MQGRIVELRDLCGNLEAGDVDACNAARKIGQALRGSGGSFGFPELSAVAAIVEASRDEDALRHVEGLIADLQILSGAEGAEGLFQPEWLVRAAGLSDLGVVDGAKSVKDAWDRVAKAANVTPEALVERVATYLGVGVAELSKRHGSALRLVPQALMSAGRVLPLSEDSLTITVATAEPASLPMELEVERLTGRRPVFVVASPDALEEALAEVLEPAERLKESPPTPVRPIVDQADIREKSILVVDDDASSRLLVRAVLEKRGYQVVEAGDGLEALQAMDGEDQVGLVVADLNMPNMDGLELMWALREDEDQSDLPVIIVTGEVDEILETQLMEEGADDYIRKPLDPRLFLARVEATIRRVEN
jgi:CheY-like chemotaxis protein